MPEISIQDQKTVELAMERWRLSSEAESGWRKLSLQDLKFSFGDQWPANIKNKREGLGKPCLVMDHLQQSILMICNDQRQQRPAININPVGDDADIDTAEVLQGIVRHIEVNSDAEIAYDSSFESMVRAGFGWFRILTDYLDDEGEEQEIFIKTIRNPFSVYDDPAAHEPCHEDAQWRFVIEDMPIAAYKAEYPNSEMAIRASEAAFSGVGNNPPEWATKETIRVAEYFRYEAGEGRKKKLIWCKINAMEVLSDEIELQTRYIPVIPVFGHDVDIDGTRFLAGMVRNAQDPQRMYNYFNSKATEAIALAPTAPWIAAEGQIENHRKEWENANSGDISVLVYKAVDALGHAVGPPSRSVVEPAIEAIAHMTAQAGNDLKASIGIYDASLGSPGPEQSGKAILARQKQGDNATLNYSDNLARSMRCAGRVLLDLIPKTYDVPRVQRIMKPDGTAEMVMIHNGPDQADVAQQMAQEVSIKRIYDIGVGKYDVAISVGPSYQSKRQEAAAVQVELLKTLPPEQSALLTDLMVANFDIPQAREMAARIKKTLPPQIVNDDPGDPEAQLQSAQSQLQALGQQHEQVTMALQQATQIINTKHIETQGKVQIAQMQETAKTEIVKMQEATKLAVAQINASKDANQSFAELESQEYQLLHTSAHEAAQQQVDHAAAAQQAQAAAQQQVQASAQDHAQNLETQTVSAQQSPSPNPGDNNA